MMDELDRGAFWWTSVPGPHGAVVAAADALGSAHTVLLCTPEDTSWQDTLRGVLEEQFKNRTGAYDMIVTRIRAKDCPAGTDPGRFLLGRYASPSDQKRFRPGGRTSVQEFLRKNGILSNRLFWVHNLDDTAAEDWLRFVRGLTQKRTGDGLFILEGDIQPPDTPGQRVSVIDLQKRITRDDVHLFTHFVLGTGSRTDAQWAEYAAAVAARLCGTDAWLAARLAEDPALRTQGPIQVLEDLFDDDRCGRGISCADHPFRLLRDGRMEELTHRVWAAQIQVLFPILEMERLSIIRTWNACVQRALDEFPLERFGTRITVAEEVELGALVHMMGTRVGPAQFHLYLPAEEVRDRIVFLHQCRNVLAHADICSPGDVARLFALDAKSAH